MKTLKRLINYTCFSVLSASATMAIAASAPETDGPNEINDGSVLSIDHHRTDPNAAMLQHDAATAGIVSSAPFAKVIKNLAPAGHGERLVANATTDVWAQEINKNKQDSHVNEKPKILFCLYYDGCLVNSLSTDP